MRRSPMAVIVCIVLPAALGIALIGCTGSKDREPGEARALSVRVSVPPHVSFVKRIGGSRVDVASLVTPGVDPHTYEPTPRQITELGRAIVYFKAGFPFEESILKKMVGILPAFRIVDLREGIPLRNMEEEGGEEEAGHDDGTDPHVWLSPRYALIQARTILENLVRLAPEHEGEFRENFSAFSEDIRRLDSELAGTLAPVKGKTIFVYHPSYGYLADEYGFRQEAVEHGGDEPTPRRLESLIEAAKAGGIRTIFIEPEFSRKSADAIADAINGNVVILNPLEEDWLQGMRTLAAAIARGLIVNP